MHRQFIAAGFEEEVVRECVKDVIDALIDIGDITLVRLDGKASLVLSRSTWVSIGEATYAMLGNAANTPKAANDHRLYTRLASSLPMAVTPLPFSDWLGPAGFHSHLARRLVGQAGGTIRELWDGLTAMLRKDGNPLDPSVLRAVVRPPGTTGYFGRHSAPSVSGRWTSSVPDGVWCGVRPGRNPEEWHPILASVYKSEAQALDLHDWDEWTWALMARGVALGAPERSSWESGVLTFEHPIPAQFVRALRLLGGPGQRTWTWQVSEAANHCFDEWRRAHV
jgi:hypothetical protein